MDGLIALVVAPVRDHAFMRDALLAVVAVGLTASVLSCLLVVRRQALMGDAISHAVLLGVVVGWLTGRGAGVLAGALAAGVASGAAVAFLERAGIQLDAAMGIVSTTALALAVAIVSVVRPAGVDLFHVLMGNLLGVSPDDLVLVACVGAAVLAFVAAAFRGLQLWCLDPAFAQAAGLPVRTLHYASAALLSATIVAAIQAVGVLLVVAVLVTPGTAAAWWVRRLGPMMVVAGAISVSGGVLGLYGSYHLDVASGPMVVIATSSIFLATLLLAPGRGLLARALAARRRRATGSPPAARAAARSGGAP